MISAFLHKPQSIMSYPFTPRYFSGIFKTGFATDQMKARERLGITLNLEAAAEFLMFNNMSFK